jgi:hypothetical protein
MDFEKQDVGERIVRVTSNSEKNILPFKNQVFEALKQECLQSGRLFEDPLFPAVDRNMFYTQPVPTGARWKRPKEICPNPMFIIDEATTGDLDQGYLGNCKKCKTLIMYMTTLCKYLIVSALVSRLVYSWLCRYCAHTGAFKQRCA